MAKPKALKKILFVDLKVFLKLVINFNACPTTEDTTKAIKAPNPPAAVG
ncbi:MAG: hypothetical protein GX800_08860 [Clostridiaceae bacterium]|nr:hypothetical protein [Clostridiaceae bacterium]